MLSVEARPVRYQIYLTALIVFLAFVACSLLVDTAQAWNCSSYNFRVTASGEVQAENHSGSNEGAQKADVFVNGSKVINDATVPALPKGTDWTTFSSITPPSGTWTWRVKGETDCEDSGEHAGPAPTPLPTSTPPPVPSATPQPTATETESPTEPAGTTPAPTATPVPTETAVPTQSPTPVDPTTLTPVPPTQTQRPPEPTNTPVPPTSKPPATATDRPLGTPFALGFSTPTATPTYGCAACCCVCPCGAYASTPIIVNVNVDIASQGPAAPFQLSAPVAQAEPDLRRVELEVFAVFVLSGANLILTVYLILSRKASSS